MTYDHIIVGGGSAGCVAANRLVRNHSARVLLLEAGGSHRRPYVSIPAGAFKMLFGDGDYLERYQSVPQPSLDGRQVEIAQGNLLGGGSSVNAMTYMRGLASDYDHWDAELGGAGWAWRDLLPYFARHEKNSRLTGPTHGTNGPLHVQDQRYICKTAHLFVETMRRRGLPLRDDFNSGETIGVGFTQISATNGRRCSAANAFVDPLRSDRRLTIRLGAKATRIIFDGMRAVGVRYLDNGTIREARCEGDVLLAAGAYISPKLLMLSGIGPAEHLGELGIPVLSDLPGVGQGMQDHNMVPVMALCKPGFGYHGEDRGWRLAANVLRYALQRRGPLASNGSESLAFENLQDSSAEPNLQIYCMGFLPPGVVNSPGMMLCPTLIRPASTGWMRLRSADPLDRPLISPNFLSDPKDLELMLSAVRHCREILSSAPLSSIVTQELAPGGEAVGDDALGAFCRASTFTNYHPVGSCRMGRATDSMAVVDGELKVRGIEGLRVCDASVMPKIPGANTNAPTMVIADRCVDLMTGAPA